MDVYLVDGTYELFRHFFALPPHVTREGREVSAARGALGYLLSFLESGVTHIGVATDQVIESFRNEMWAAYKTGEGVDQRLLDQFPLLEEGMSALGIANWPMKELEADDGLAAVAAFADASSEVEHVYVCSPDKDLAQCVRGERVVQVIDRRNAKMRDEAGVIERFGVAPKSIPDYLALVGDSADGYPGLPGWGARSTATLLAAYGHIESIPSSAAEWQVSVRGADKLAATLVENRELAMLFRDLATLRIHKPALTSIEELRWLGPAPQLVAFSEYVEMPALLQRAQNLARRGL
ncbi:MAG TPA: 5'-3' exonuclease H3TH domain-containing protein [Dehalococcoidia bacterium]|nr:5'-3' exonuclease H3TH domain-containing protein [Dehalococcoidia bacterium]